MKKRLSLIAVLLAAILGISATILFLVDDYQNDKEQKYINAHASTTAIVVEKYIKEGPRGGYYFCVVAEHASVTSEGENVTFTIDYSLPEENLEDYFQVQVGDKIIAKYTPFTRGGLWRFVSFEKGD